MKARIPNAERRVKCGSLAIVAFGRSAFRLRHSKPPGAFTILEVTVACTIFFMVAFAILAMVTQCLVGVRAIQHREPDPGIILASLSFSNAFEEGSMSGNFEDIAPGMYPGARWIAEIEEVGTNGLFEIRVATYNDKRKSQNPVAIAGRFFRPLSKPGSVSKGRL